MIGLTNSTKSRHFPRRRRASPGQVTEAACQMLRDLSLDGNDITDLATLTTLRCTPTSPPCASAESLCITEGEPASACVALPTGRIIRPDTCSPDFLIQ